MKKYTVRVPFQGYCRGTTTCTIEANSPEEALDRFNRWSGEDDIIRDDRDFLFEDADIIEIN